MFDKTVKNQEIQEAFAGQLATGQPVIFSVEQTANPDYVVLGIAQTIKTEGSATEEQKLFLGFGDFESTVRCLQNVKLEQLPTLAAKFGTKIEPGAILKGSNIQINESTEPRSWLNKEGKLTYQKAKVYPASHKFAGRQMVTEDNGKSIYRNTELKLGPVVHNYIKGVAAGTPEAVAAENAGTFAELAGVEA